MGKNRMKFPIDISAVLTCDQVRREDNGKAIIIGVYVSDILLPQIPTMLGMTWYIQGINKVEGEYEMEFQISLEDDPYFRPIEVKTKFQHSSIGSTSVVVLGQIPVTFMKPCSLILRARFRDEEWHELTRSKALVNPPAVISPSVP
jgi:hypothetical protein